MIKSCSHCYYRGDCFQRTVCDDYYPIGRIAEDNAMDEYIEEERIKFYEEWFEYINEYDD